MKKVLLLAQQAFTENGETYEAMATDVFANEYLVVWEVRDDYDADACDTEDCACDWNSPLAIFEYGTDNELNLEDVELIID